MADENPHPGPQQHIATTLQEHLERVLLPSQAGHRIRPGLDERGIQHVAEEGEDRIWRIELGLSRSNVPVLNMSQELGKNGEVEDQRSSQERVLTLIQDVDGSMGL